MNFYIPYLLIISGTDSNIYIDHDEKFGDIEKST